MAQEAREWWMHPGFVAFDTETTGVDPEHDRIVTAAVVRFEGGEPVAARSWLLRVDIPIPAASTEVHGITDEIAQRDGSEQVSALVEIRDALIEEALPVVAFNAAFDMAMLVANLARVGQGPMPDIPVICPYVLDRQLDRYVSGANQRRLQPTLERYGLTIGDDEWHGAEADAAVTGRLFLAQVAAHQELRWPSAPQLAHQVGAWRRQQDAAFQAWLEAQPPRPAADMTEQDC